MAILENCPTEPILSNKYYKLYQSNHQVPAWVREYPKFNIYNIQPTYFCHTNTQDVKDMEYPPTT